MADHCYIEIEGRLAFDPKAFGKVTHLTIANDTKRKDKNAGDEERVRQVLALAHAPTRALRPPPRIVPLVCDNCGVLFERRQRVVLGNARAKGYKGKWVACSIACNGVLRVQRAARRSPQPT